ncbi:MAG: hypothetical protein GF419_09910 [Ignavibacteriales bacterium]|jgi:hypothetical protein|nr:hypothetical protein [Ignavibacteriales bacterium]
MYAGKTLDSLGSTRRRNAREGATSNPRRDWFYVAPWTISEPADDADALERLLRREKELKKQLSDVRTQIEALKRNME